MRHGRLSITPDGTVKEREGKTGQVGDVKPLLVNEGQGINVINRIVD